VRSCLLRVEHDEVAAVAWRWCLVVSTAKAMKQHVMWIVDNAKMLHLAGVEKVVCIILCGCAKLCGAVMHLHLYDLCRVKYLSVCVAAIYRLFKSCVPYRFARYLLIGLAPLALPWFACGT